MSALPDTQRLWLTITTPKDGKVQLGLAALPPASQAGLAAMLVVRGMLPGGKPMTLDLPLASASSIAAQVGLKL